MENHIKLSCGSMTNDEKKKCLCTHNFSYSKLKSENIIPIAAQNMAVFTFCYIILSYFFFYYCAIYRARYRIAVKFFELFNSIESHLYMLPTRMCVIFSLYFYRRNNGEEIPRHTICVCFSKYFFIKFFCKAYFSLV